MVPPVQPSFEKPVSSHPRFRGAVVGGAGVTLAVAGLWQVNGVLAALGVALCALLALAWVFGRLNLAHLSATFDAPATVAAGAAFPCVLAVRNRRWFWDAFDLCLELELPHRTRAPGRAGWIAAGSAADLELRLAVPTRCHRAAHPLRLWSAFPLGLFEMRRTLVVEHELLVFPRPVTPRGMRALGVLVDAAPRGGSAAGELAGEPRGLRSWRPGDRMKRIDWPASIRAWWHGAGLVSREMDPPGFQPRRCMVLFHSFGTDGSLIRPDRFERALSLASGALRQLQSMGIPARLLADFDGWEDRPSNNRSQLALCQETLARAVRTRGSEAHDVQAAAQRAAPDEVVVAISDMPAASWRQSLPKLPLPPLVVEIPEPRNRGKSARPTAP